MADGDTAGLARLELLQVADAVAREKGIERELVLEAMEQAITHAGKRKYGQEHDIRTDIDRETGEIKLMRYLEVAEEIENEATQIAIGEAQERNPAARVGDYLADPLPPIDFGRIAAQTAKQVIVQKVREAERARQYEEYKDRVQEIANGLVKRTEYGGLTVDLGRAEAVIRREDLLPRESFRNGDRVRGYIYDVRREPRGPQIFMSRTHPNFMSKLFAQEVPEIYDGIIEIDAVARDPGSRAKIAVHSNDSSIDPVGACVGMRGSRVQAVVGELQGEKIDIIQWSPDPAAFIVNALAPAEVTKVVLDEEAKRIEVVVPDEQLSLAIGRRGQNVRLASNLTGWDIDILTEAEESERRQEEFRTRSEMFMEALDVDDVIAHLLVTEGFTTVDEVAYVPIEELAMIEGFEEDLAVELSSRAAAYVEAMNKELNERRIELGVSDEIAAIEGLDPAILVALGENDVKTLDDLGDLAGDELIEILGDLAPSIEEANAVIMMARAHWFDDEEPMDGAEAGDAGEAAEAGDAAEDRRRGARETQRLTASAHMQDRPASPDAGSRRCIASGASKPRDTLLRFVVDPAGALVPDLGESLPGRGLWVSAERAALEKACERGLFARAARRPIAVAPDLIDEVERQLIARSLDILGLARRAGALVTGFDKVQRALTERRVAVLVEASDGARHGRARLGALARDIPVIAQFDGAALSRSLGRGNVVHAALAPGRFAERFVRESERLAGVRGNSGDRDMA